MPPLRLGKLRAGAADLHITIARNRRPLLRVDLYAGRETFCFTDAVAWGRRVFAGYGDTVYVIDPARKTGSVLALESYFGSFYTTPDCFLVASGERLLRFSPLGALLWKSLPLGIDGVVVDRIENQLIQGQGEWDPPGGWRPFAITLDSGVPIV